jgi:hypothetical protein
MDMKQYSTSPDRGSFLRGFDLKRLQAGDINQEQFDIFQQKIDDIPKENNLEYDLRSNERMLAKARNSEIYCTDLYSALCNNQFFYGDKEWSCTWRYAGGIIADMIQKGDYIDWYCSGNEGFVTDEIKLDLIMMGWIVKPYEDNLT